MTDTATPPPKPADGCWNCAAWTQGPFVVLGDSLGTCQQHDRWTRASDLCLAHHRSTIRKDPA